RYFSVILDESLGGLQVRVHGLEDPVGVGTAVAKRVDADTTRLLAMAGPRRKWSGVSDDVDSPLISLDLWVQLPDTNSSRDQTLLQREDRLDNAGEAAGSLAVAEVCLDGADERGTAPPGLVKDAGECLDLDGVADAGARAVGLD